MKFKESWNMAMKFATVKLGLLVGLIAYGITWLLALINVKPFEWSNAFVHFTASGLPVEVNLRQEVTRLPQVGSWFLNMVGAYGNKVGSFLQLNWMDLFGVIVGAIVLVFIGTLLRGLIGEWIGGFIKNPEMKRVWAVLVYGAIATALLMGLLTGLDYLGTLVAMLLYMLFVAALMMLALKYIPFARKLA